MIELIILVLSLILIISGFAMANRRVRRRPDYMEKLEKIRSTLEFYSSSRDIIPEDLYSRSLVEAYRDLGDMTRRIGEITSGMNQQEKEEFERQLRSLLTEVTTKLEMLKYKRELPGMKGVMDKLYSELSELRATKPLSTGKPINLDEYGSKVTEYEEKVKEIGEVLEEGRRYGVVIEELEEEYERLKESIRGKKLHEADKAVIEDTQKFVSRLYKHKEDPASFIAFLLANKNDIERKLERLGRVREDRRTDIIRSYQGALKLLKHLSEDPLFKTYLAMTLEDEARRYELSLELGRGDEEVGKRELKHIMDMVKGLSLTPVYERGKAITPIYFLNLIRQRIKTDTRALRYFTRRIDTVGDEDIKALLKMEPDALKEMLSIYTKALEKLYKQTVKMASEVERGIFGYSGWKSFFADFITTETSLLGITLYSVSYTHLTLPTKA